MTHNITKEQYINNPCRSSSTAYWKNASFQKPDNIKVIHERNYFYTEEAGEIIKYFRLFHNLKDIMQSPGSDVFVIQNVNIETEKELVAEFLSKCYNNNYSADFIGKMTETNVFDNDLWVWAIEKDTILPVALGIADFDKEIGEGSLEWVQVLPSKQKLGLGKLIVCELLSRLKKKADFVTVSGEIDSLSKPEMLYRKCGFTGDDVWYVIHTE